MFGVSKDSLWEARIEDLKKEHQRTVEALTAWIEQLQMQLGAASLAAKTAPDAGMPAMSMFVNEEEAALDDALEMGLLTKEQHAEELSRLQFSNAELG